MISFFLIYVPYPQNYFYNKCDHMSKQNSHIYAHICISYSTGTGALPDIRMYICTCLERT